MVNKITKKLILFWAVILGVYYVNAQVSGLKTNASAYSDTEIIAMIKKAESAGLDENQVVELARAQGLTETEINAFRERVEKLKREGSSTAVTENSALGKLPPKEINNNSVENNTEGIKIDGTKPAADEKPKVPESVAVKGSTDAPEIVATSWDVAQLFDEKRFPAYSNGRALKAPEQYIIGVGDEISVTVFGNSYFNKVSRVDDRGRIDLGTVLGKVYVKGLEFSQLERVLKSAVGSKINLSGNEMVIDLSFSRQISINVTGEIQRPGTYQIPAANTVFNLLVLSGGPTASGSIRDIEVVRGGKVITRFDVYAYLMNPKNNWFLEDGDYVVVKPVRKRVTIKGGVLRPGRIELYGDEGLEAALKYVGGLSTKANPKRMTLSRLNGVNRTLYNVDYVESLKKKTDLPLLLDGDEIVVFEQTDDTENRVQISGEVFFAGDYALVESLDIAQLIAAAGGLKPEANDKVAFLIRRSLDESVTYEKIDLRNPSDKAIKLQAKDQLVIFAQARFRDAFEVEIRGEIRNAVKMPYKEGMKLSDLIDYAGGLKYSADLTEVEILRSSIFTEGYQNGQENKTVRLKMNLSKESPNTVTLQKEDVVLVRSISNLNDRIGVRVEGEVLHPGVFVMAKNENRVSDLISFSGGLTEFGDAGSAQLFRANGTQLVFDLQSVLKEKNSEYNYRLEEGDRLVVPLVQDLVVLTNTDTLVNKKFIFAPYHAGKRAGYYIRNYSLGFDKQYRKHLLYVEEPSGRIKRSRHYGLFVITPTVKAGSKIRFQPAPKKKEKVVEENKKETDWNRIFEGITVKLTAVATLWVLLSRI